MHNTLKKQLQKNKNNQKRAFNSFNTGTRTMKSEKDYKRLSSSQIQEKYLDDMESVK